MSSENPKFVRARRSLNVISIGIIVYFAAGASFKDLQIRVLGSPLENPKVAMALIWVGFFYFVWRFAVESHEARKKFEEERLCAIGKIAHYKEFVEQQFCSLSEADRRGFNQQALPLIVRGFFKRQLQVGSTYSSSSAGFGKFGISSYSTTGAKETSHIDVPFWKHVWYETRGDLFAVLNGSGFADYGVPIALAIIAVAAASLKLFGAY